MKKILIITSMDRCTRILLRTTLFESLKKEYEIIIASPAERSQQWKDDFKDVTFFSSYLRSDSNIKDAMKMLDLSAIISCSNTDVPVHSFDVNFQRVAKGLDIPIIIVQDFIDAIFHPMVVEPDLYLCWGDFFKRMFSRKRDVMCWDSLGSLLNNYIEEPINNIKVCGVPHFDVYKNNILSDRNEFIDTYNLKYDKPIFTYLPNGELSKWVFDTFDNFMQTADKFNAQVIIKTHPVRYEDNWIYELITKNYKNVDVHVFTEPSASKGKAFGVKDYNNSMYRFDDNDQLVLGDILKNSDIFCSIPSTTAIEAFIFNKPVVMETSYWNHPNKVRENVMKWYWNLLYSYNCCDINVVNTELINMINDNINNPDKYMDGRKHIVQDFFNGAQGDACQNMLNAIKEFLG